ncbi:Trk system potassium uptake protein TrkA [Clostridiales bacterium]|nr:Trk system potassium transporter TrkA [Eubacterium sp.]GFI70896.1 Trk system potassium uptake protein TrkA [Clostridiales bacterium]
MDVIIVGCGKLGSCLAKNLSEENHNITVFDKNEDLVNSIVDKYDVQGYVGGATIKKDLEEVGAKKADLLIATTASDENNILSCFIAHRMGTKHTIARVRNPEYIKQINFMRSELGISLLINPDFSAALEIMRMIQFPSAMNVESFADGRVDLAEVKISSTSPIANSKVGNISSKFKNGMIICAVARGNDVYIPNGDFEIREKDKIYITGHHKYLSSIINQLNPAKKFDNIKNIMIIGGSRIAFYLAGMLEGQSKNVILVEKDIERCEQLSDLLDKTTVICGDANEYDFMKEEGIENMDAVVTLTNNDELNIMFTAFSEACNVPKNITKINNPNLSILLDKFSSDSFINVTDIASDTITHYVRSKKHVGSGEMKRLYKLVGGKVEAAEFVVDVKTRYVGKMLSDIGFKNNVLIASISRKGKIIFPKGDDTIEIGDRLIVVTKERKIEKINDIFD